MKYAMPDERIVIGRGYRDIVQAMQDEKLVEPRSSQSYRKAAAKRAEDMYKVPVDPSTDKSFVKSLEAAGVLKRLAF